MSKVQLLYEKIMKIMFIFTGIFFVLCIIILFFAMGDGVIDCSSSMLCSIEDTYGFYTYSIIPLAIGTLVFLILGRVFYSMAYRERKLQTVEEYKAELDRKSYDKWRQMTKDKPAKSSKTTNDKPIHEAPVIDEQPEVKVLEGSPEEKIKMIKKEGALTKTRLIAYISEVHHLSLIEARGFVNALFQVMTNRLNNNDNVDFDEFGRIEKLVNDEGAHVEFFPYGELSDALTLESFVYESLYVPPVEVIDTHKDDVLKEQLKQAERLAQDQMAKEEAEAARVQKVQEESVIATAVKLEEQHKEEPRVRQEKRPNERSQESVANKTKEEPQVKKVVLAKKKPQPLTKTKVIASIAESTGLSKNKSDKFVKSLLDVIKQSLLDREDVQLEGLGKFTTIEMPAKKAVNPQTQESIVVPAHHQVRFRFNPKFEQSFKE